MAKKKKEELNLYWDNRAVEQERKMHDQLPDLEKKVFDAYATSQKYLTKQATNIYERYLREANGDKEYVKKVLNTTIEPSELVELQSLAKTIEDPYIKKQVKTYLDGLSAKFRITRLEDLKAKAYITSKRIADLQQIKQTDFYIDVIQEAYNESAAEAIIGRTEKKWVQPNELEPQPYKYKSKDNVIEIVDWQTGTIDRTISLKKDLPFKFKELSTNETRNILDTKFYGKNYSEAIWGDTDRLANRLQELFTVESMTGMSEMEMARELQSEFNVASNIAKRLIRTEANLVSNQAKLKGWEKHGVLEYVIVAVLDFRTSKICQEQDGKKYKIVDAKLAVNYPPFHAWCRTVVRAYFGKSTLSGTRTANNPITGEQFTISMTDTYKDWEKDIIAQSGKKDMILEKRKVRNFTMDKNQYDKYKGLLPEKDVPSSLDAFQNLKYTDKEKWEKLKELYRKTYYSKRSTA